MSIRQMFLGKRAVQVWGDEPPEGDPLPQEHRAWRHGLYVLRRDALAAFGVVWIVVMIGCAVFAPIVAPYPTQGAGRSNAETRLLPPSAAHWMGTDELGRDVLSRIIYGAQPALLAPLIVVAIAVVVGTPLGALAGYAGGWLDETIMRITDLFLAFPSLLLAMAIVALLGPSLLHAVVALTVSWWPWYTRLVRGITVSLRGQYFVEAARALGVPTYAILWRHILPNSLSAVLVQATLDIGTVILATTSLAFIGLGTQPPYADWGLMIEQGRGFLHDAWWYSFFAGLAIFLTVLSFNVIGDVLRDLFDPRQYR
ncbi:MAG: ABC transporter permease [Chloroflexota bacterium]